MGLSSSQARLLTITARMHQIEYKAARLEAMKLQMANESRQVYEEYLNALDKTKVQVKTLTTNGAVTYQDITSYNDFLSAGYALNWHGSTIDINSTGSTTGNLYQKDGKYYGINDLPKTTAGAVNESGYTKIVANWTNLLAALGITSAPHFEETLTNIINSGQVTIVQGEKTTTGWKFRQETATDFADWETSISTNTGLQEVTDEIELRKAEAKYEADMKRIDLKDRRYDTDLAALDSERNALKQEMETLKTVTKDNVERTFKLFS